MPATLAFGLFAVLGCFPLLRGQAELATEAGALAAANAPALVRAPDADWINAVDFRGKSSRVALEELGRAVDLKLDPEEHAARLDTAVKSDVSGKSRLEAIEILCADLGLFPAYPMFLHFDRSSLSLQQGPRPWGAAVFRGPFAIYADRVEQHVPYTTGSVELHVSAFGLTPAFVRAVKSLDGAGSLLTGVVDSKGRSLIQTPETDQVLYGTNSSHLRPRPSLVENAYHLVWSVELKNLWREVEHFRIEGTHKYRTSGETLSAEFSSLEVGAEKSTDGVTFKIVAHDDDYVVYQIRGQKEKLATADVRCSAKNAEGTQRKEKWKCSEPREGGELYTNFRIDRQDPPVSMRLDLVVLAEVEEVFQIGDIPLDLHGEMHEQSVVLAFDGGAPVSVEFLRAEASGSSAEIHLRISNRSNKAIHKVYLQSVAYFDSAGEDLGAGEVWLDPDPKMESRKFGYHPSRYVLLSPGEQKEITSDLSAQLSGVPKSVRFPAPLVRFADGTWWQAK